MAGNAMFNVFVERIDAISILHINGDLVLETIPGVTRFWLKILASRPRIVVLDCKNITHIDSTAIATLVSFLNTAMDRRIRLVFCDVNEPITALFAAARLNRHFYITSMDSFTRKFIEPKVSPVISTSSFVTA